jgi:hypothetical protein
MRRALVLAALLVAFPASAQVEKVLGILVQAPYCGDGNIDAGESCDGSNIGSHTCAEFSCSGGTPTCSGSCTITATGCSGCAAGDLLDEAFTGSQTDGVTAGFDDASWTKSGDGASGDKPIPNPNAVTGDGCATGTGWSGDCLKIAVNPNLAAFHNVKETNAFTATASGVWFHARLKQSFTIATDAHSVDVMSIGTAGAFAAAGSVYLQITRTAGPVYTLGLVAVGGGFVGAGYTIASGDSICVEVYLNSSTTTAEWWVNGTSMGSTTDPTTMNVTPTNLWLGVAAAPSSSDNETQYWDQVQVSSTGRLACN